MTERNHTIEFQMNDTACDRGTGIYKFVEMVTHKIDVSSQSIHAVIGRYIYITGVGSGGGGGGGARGACAPPLF